MLDFPNNPTLGQQWIGSNGALYTWDGAVWALSSPSTPISQWTDNGTALVPNKGASYPIDVGAINVPLGGDILWGAGNPSIQTDANGNLNLAAGATAGGIAITPAPGFDTKINSNLRIEPNDQLIFDHTDANPPGATTLGTIRFASSNRTGAQILSKTDAAWSGTASPGRLTFSVGVGSTLADALTIDGNGYSYITSRARIGSLTLVPRDSLELTGGLILGQSQAITPVAGNIQFFNGHFQGYNGTAWVNLD